jgi:hypothetical protein
MNREQVQKELNEAAKSASGGGVGFVAAVRNDGSVVVRRDEEFANSTEIEFQDVHEALGFLEARGPRAAEDPVRHPAGSTPRGRVISRVLKEPGAASVRASVYKALRRRRRRPNRMETPARGGRPGRGKKDPHPGLVEIYDQALETHARKGRRSAYPGEEFVHHWESPGTRILGLPRGTRLQTPDGNAFELTSRSVLMDSRKGKDLWDEFRQ